MRAIVVPFLAIVAFWLVGGVIGGWWMKRMIDGFPTRMAVEVLAVLWGILVAILTRWMIVSLDFALIATIIAYLVGAVVSGPPRREQSESLQGTAHDLAMRYNYPYFKREIVSTIPLITYIIVSAIIFFAWHSNQHGS